MKALSLWQPLAQLVALDEKTVETRGWRTNYRGQLAIHAAKRPPDGVRRGGWFASPAAVRGKGQTEWVLRHGDNNRGLPLNARPLPLGAVVATAYLVDCVPTGPLSIPGAEAKWIETNPGQINDRYQAGDVTMILPYDPTRRPLPAWDLDANRPLGDFGPDRWLWLLTAVRPLPEPIPATGRQGLWEWDPPTPHGVLLVSDSELSSPR